MYAFHNKENYSFGEIQASRKYIVCKPSRDVFLSGHFQNRDGPLYLFSSPCPCPCPCPCFGLYADVCASCALYPCLCLCLCPYAFYVSSPYL